MEGPLVTVGVPVYRGQDWVATTLECLRTQSYSKLDVLISIDGPDPASLAACRPFLADGRFRPEAQPSRRGWAENINWTMSRRRGEFFIFQQQDDQVSPTYIADLVAAAARCPKAAICYSKMEVSGIESGMVRHKPLLGHPAKRVLTYLERMDTSMFLGLIRSAAIAATSGLPTNAFDSFGAELPFMAELARVGEFRFVEGPTYFKRLHGRNTHLQWYAWPEDRKRAAWLRLAVAMVDAVVPAGKSLTERRHLFYTVLDRFLTARGHRRWSFCKLDDRDTNTRRAMVRTMIELLRESRLDLPACLETRSDSIERLIARRFEMFTRLEPHASSLPA